VSTPNGGNELATNETLSKTVLAEVGDLRRTMAAEYLVSVDHFVPSLSRVQNTLYPGATWNHDRDVAEMRHKHQVLLSVWERDRITPQMAGLLNRFAQNWVPCEANKRILVEAGVANTHVVPHPFSSHSPLIRIGDQKKVKSAGEPFLFYMIGKWEPRKSTHEIIGAFLREFHYGDLAILGLKTNEKSNWMHYPAGPLESVSQWLEDDTVKRHGWTHDNWKTGVRINTQRLPIQGIWKIHHVGDCYISASHGEAWDLPAFDACVARSRMIHAGFGGSEDYAPKGSTLRFWNGGEMALVHGAYAWPRGCKWAKLDYFALQARMREAYEDRRVGDPIDLRKYSFEVVGKQMRELCREVSVKNGVRPDWSD
jgi:hypothetical protein